MRHLDAGISDPDSVGVRERPLRLELVFASAHVTKYP